MPEITEECVRVNGIPKRLVIFLHGYIDTAFSLEKRLEPLFESLDNVAFHLPQAPIECEIYEKKRQWFSLHRFDPEDERKTIKSLDDCIKIYDKMKPGVIEAGEYIQRYIENCVLQYDIPYENVFLAGFSQGGTMAIYLALMQDEKIGGCIDFNGVMTPAPYLMEKHISKPDFLLIHGTNDNLVRFGLSDFSENNLKKIGCNVEKIVINEGRHMITPEGMKKTAEFINLRS